MQVSAIPSGPTYYQPIQAVRPPMPVARQETDADGNAQKVRPTRRPAWVACWTSRFRAHNSAH